MQPGVGPTTLTRKPVPRGIATTGPALLSYGFRPFFLLAALYAFVAMATWIGALSMGWSIGGETGMLAWHAHEMLFGYASAVLAGFMLTAIPNWTGRLPVSGRPLLALVLLWLAGRLVMAFPDILGQTLSLLVDASFLPLLALIAGIEIASGRNWRNLKILAGLAALSLANVWFAVMMALTGSASDASRPAVSAYIMLIALVGGRIIPSFTRNWLVKRGSGSVSLPAPFDRFDIAAMSVLLFALITWVAEPTGIVTAGLAITAGSLNAVRLWRWRGWQTLEEPLLLALHLAYGFIPLGLFGIALAAMDWIAAPSALHILVVGAIGNMTFTVMARASLGHTGRPMTASPGLSIALLSLLLSAIVRPLAEIFPSHYHLLLEISGGSWLLAFGLFVAVFAPILLRPRVRAQSI